MPCGKQSLHVSHDFQSWMRHASLTNVILLISSEQKILLGHNLCTFRFISPTYLMQKMF